MRRLAERFVQYAHEGFSAGILTGSAEQGEPFGWESTEAARLDGICEDFLDSDPPPSDEVRHSMIMSMGAYLGELLVRHGGDQHEQVSTSEDVPGRRARLASRRSRIR